MNEMWRLLIDNVEKALTSKSWKQADLARESGIPPKQLSSYMVGRTEPGFDKISQISKALNIEPWKLLMPDGAFAVSGTEHKVLEEKFAGTIAELAAAQRALTAALARAEKAEGELERKYSLPPDLSVFIEGLKVLNEDERGATLRIASATMNRLIERRSESGRLDTVNKKKAVK